MAKGYRLLERKTLRNVVSFPLLIPVAFLKAQLERFLNCALRWREGDGALEYGLPRFRIGETCGPKELDLLSSCVKILLVTPTEGVCKLQTPLGH